MMKSKFWNPRFKHNLLTWVELGVILGIGWLILWVAAIVDVGGR